MFLRVGVRVRVQFTVNLQKNHISALYEVKRSVLAAAGYHKLPLLLPTAPRIRFQFHTELLCTVQILLSITAVCLSVCVDVNKITPDLMSPSGLNLVDLYRQTRVYNL